MIEFCRDAPSELGRVYEREEKDRLLSVATAEEAEEEEETAAKK